jgi:hypothetical protein
MQLHEVEKNVAHLDVRQGFELIFALLRAYGVSSASITRLQRGGYNKAAEDNAVLWKDKVYYRFLDAGEDLHAAIDEARRDESIGRLRPRFFVVRDDVQLLAIDTRTRDTLDTRLVDLPSYSAFFLPWAGIEKVQLESINYADVKAAERMARLYDEILKHNRIETVYDAHRLNVFFTRLLFCFFAEDTGVFSDGVFTNGIASNTDADGSDLDRYLDELFHVLDTPVSSRERVPSHFAGFGYVNGRLFSSNESAPTFSRLARQLVVDCGKLNWSVINPDIFGSMMQAVVQPGQRESLGMHYTSVENIMKVIRPLFLDELQSAFGAADTKAKLTRLHKRIAAVKCFDPACGSGNFLVIAYKELRKLEHCILQRLQEINLATPLALFRDSKIKLDNFYGIEIDDFAHEVAILSLWLAKHQMNVEFRDLFGADIRLIPLRDTGNITCANAITVNWNDVCPTVPDDELYVLGNPPYLGASLQSDEQKEDFARFFGTAAFPRNLDYIALWFLKAANYVRDGVGTVGFVATNSIVQGEQVALLWPSVLDAGVEIVFAHESFRWSNQARANAGVTCVVVGLSAAHKSGLRPLYSAGQVRMVSNINPYLKPSSRDTVVVARRNAVAGLSPMLFGSKPADGGHLILEPHVAMALRKSHPEAAAFIRRFVGAAELLRDEQRYALWITQKTAFDALAVPPIRERVERVKFFRASSKKAATRDLATVPYRFGEVRHRDTTAVVVPLHSSERRNYIPMSFIDGRTTVVSNACSVVYDAEPWLFALMTSQMHNVWVSAVCGRIKTDFRYSATLCYNTFPVPQLSDKSRDLLTHRAFDVLEARERHSDQTLAQLYDLAKMPDDLRDAHQFLDTAVDQLYRKRPFQSDDERLGLLFDLYEVATAGVVEPAKALETASA